MMPELDKLNFPLECKLQASPISAQILWHSICHRTQKNDNLSYPYIILEDGNVIGWHNEAFSGSKIMYDDELMRQVAITYENSIFIPGTGLISPISLIEALQKTNQNIGLSAQNNPKLTKMRKDSIDGLARVLNSFGSFDIKKDKNGTYLTTPTLGPDDLKYNPNLKLQNKLRIPSSFGLVYYSPSSLELTLAIRLQKKLSSEDIDELQQKFPTKLKEDYELISAKKRKVKIRHTSIKVKEGKLDLTPLNNMLEYSKYLEKEFNS